MQINRSLIGIAGFLWFVGCTTPKSEFLSGKLIDLTHPLDEHTIFWPTAKEFQLEVVSAQRTEAGFYYAANNFCTAEHGGTHIDAPIHFYEGRHSVDAIPLEQLIGNAVVIDVSEKCAANADVGNEKPTSFALPPGGRSARC